MIEKIAEALRAHENPSTLETLNMLENGLAQFHGDEAGFIVTTVANRECRLWLCWGDLAGVARIEATVADWAFSIGCKSVIAQPMRPAWFRILKRLEYRKDGDLMRKEL